MAKWTKAKRDATPAKNFGDPKNREYPIEDQDDVDSAADLIGKASDPQAVKKRIIGIAKRLELTVPDAWQSKSADMEGLDLMSNDIESALYDALGDAYPPNPVTGYYDYVYVVGFNPAQNFVIFSKGGDKFRQAFDIDAVGTATLTGEPVDVTQKTTWVAESDAAGMGEFDIADFAAAVGEYVPWKSKIFECGMYPHQQVDATNPGYLDRMIGNFKGAKFKNSHSPDPQSIFSRVDLGGCDKIWREGSDLWGSGLMHRAVKALVGIPKASVEILDKIRDPKLGAIALLNFPQVQDARVAAFASYFAGARHSKGDMEHVQAVHDHCAALGAQCDAAEMGKRHSNTDQSAIQTMHDLACEQGATCKPAETTAAMSGNDQATADAGSAKENRMNKSTSLWNRFLAGLSWTTETAADAGVTQAKFEAAMTEPETSADPEMAERIAAFEKSNAALFGKMLQDTAARFANELVYPSDPKMRKAYASQIPEVKSMYVTAAEKDGGGSANFSEIGDVVEGENVKMLRSYFEKLTPLPAMAAEKIAGAAFGASDKQAVAQARIHRANEHFNHGGRA